MPRLPSAVDVPKVSPRISADPGLQPSAAAFQSPLGTAAEELAPAATAQAERLAKIELKQSKRDATIERAGNISTYTSDVDNELRRINTEADLSDPQVLQEFGGFMAKQRQDLLENHRGSEESRAVLAKRLIDIESTATGRASGISAKLGQDKVQNVYTGRLVPIGESAAQDPSLENLNRLLSQDAPGVMEDLKDAIDQSEEGVFLDRAQEHIVTSATDRLIIQGRVEQAESLLVDGGMNRFLSPEKQRETRRRIETVRFNRDAERGKLTEREKRTKQLKDRGFSDELSQDIAAGNIKVVGPDSFGDFWNVNTVTGTKVKVSEEDQESILNNLPDEIVDEINKGGEQPQEAPQERDRTIEEAVETGTGPFAKLQAGISNVFGPFMEGALFEDTTRARQQIKIFNQTAKIALTNNPKFPVAEQKIVANMLPDTDAFFSDPDTARSDLKELRKFLIKTTEVKEKQSAKRISTKRRAELADQVSKINEILSLMEEPAEDGGQQTVNSQEEVDGLKKGAKFIWGPTGDTFVKD